MDSSTRGQKKLGGLLTAQFFGAFNDNAWKLIVMALLERAVARAAIGDAAEREAASQHAATSAFVAFTVPLVLFSLPAGVLADRFSKRSVILWLKGLELVLMGIGAAALFTGGNATLLPMIVLAAMGLQSALFSPAKYGIVPELVPHEDLSRANGALEMGTFFAIIAGTGLGPVLLGVAGSHAWAAGAALALLAAVGFFAALRIPKTPRAAAPVAWSESLRTGWRALRGDRTLWLVTIGATWFWGVSSLLGQNVIVYSKIFLGLSETMTGVPLGVFGVGVGVGAHLAGKLSRGKIETGLIPLGALVLGLGVLVFGVWSPQLAGTLFLTTVLGIASGLLIVPLDALLQARAPDHCRGAVIAISNVFVFSGMLFGSLAGSALAQAQFSTRGIMLAAAVITLGGTVWAMRLLPEPGLRLAVFLMTRIFYRLRIVGKEFVPETGGALLVPNHVSFMDGMFLLAATDRPVRFIVDQGQFERPFLKPFLKILGAIPVSATGGPRGILKALRDAGKYLEDGELVCIFPEGQITRTGAMQPFRRGLERIAKGRPAPIIPVHLDRVWGSIFSYAGGKFVRKFPEEIPYPVTISFGRPLAPETPVTELRAAVDSLGAQAWMARKSDRSTLATTFRRVMRRRPFAAAAGDASREPISRLALFTAALFLGDRLRKKGALDPIMGVLLPPSIGGAVANVALAWAERTSVNLNYTAGSAGVASAIKQSGLKRVLTAKAFVERFPDLLPTDVEKIFIEDILSQMGFFDRLFGALRALFWPARFDRLRRDIDRRGDVDKHVTIIFSSGSTGEPKGVLLSHFNVDSNVEGVSQVFRIGPDDAMLGILPLFHSFGFMTLWTALNRGMPIIFHSNPLDAYVVGQLVNRYSITMLLATPTFLNIYTRRVAPEMFGSLRMVLAGAEKLTDKAATAFEERFGIRPLEGYGATECAPVIASSVPSFRAPGFFQPGSRRGYVGRPLPGIEAKIVDPDTMAPLPPETPGMLLVRGPNVMSGYLGRPDLTEKAFKDGWYVTGDIAQLDPDGFLKITDRLSRFSKIGGEMVPHGRVEEALDRAWGKPSMEPVFAVTGVPDEKKGERLAVLTTIAATEIPALLERLAGEGLPNLFIPRSDAFVRVEKIPLLGTGKVDLKGVKAAATAAVAPAVPTSH